MYDILAYKLTDLKNILVLKQTEVGQKLHKKRSKRKTQRSINVSAKFT